MKWKKSIVAMLVTTMTLETLGMSASAQALTETNVPIVEMEIEETDVLRETTEIDDLLTSMTDNSETETTVIPTEITETQEAKTEGDVHEDTSTSKDVIAKKTDAVIYAGVTDIAGDKNLSMIFESFSEKKIYAYEIVDTDGNILKSSFETVKTFKADAPLSGKLKSEEVAYITFPVDPLWPDRFTLTLTSTDDAPKYVAMTMDTSLTVQKVTAQQKIEGGTEVSWQQIENCDGYIVSLIQQNNGEMIDYKDVKEAGNCTFDVTGDNMCVQVIPYSQKKETVYYGQLSETVVSMQTEVTQNNTLTVPAVAVQNEECKYVLSWNTVEDADGYEIYDSEKNKIADVTGLTYTVKGIEGGKSYSHYVRAYQSSGDEIIYSDYSAVISAEPTMKMLAKISGLTAVGGEHEIDLKWKGSRDATGYRIYQYNPSTKKTTFIANTSSTSYSVKKLKAGSYQIVISAYRTVNGYTNETDISGAVKATVTTVVPGKATKLKQKSSECMVKLTWKAASKANGYEIQVYNKTTKQWTVVGKTSSTSYTHKGIAGGTYQYRVRSYRYINDYTEYGTVSSTVQAKPTMESLKTPTSFKASAEEHAVKLTWKKSKNATGYVVYTYDTTKKQLTKVGTTTNTTYYAEKLESGKWYTYVVKAYRTINGYTHYTGATAEKSAKPTGYTPAKVTNLKAAPAEHAVKLTWTAAKYATHYRIYRYDPQTKKNTYITTVKTNNYTTDANLEKGVSYSYMIIPLRSVHRYETRAAQSNIVSAAPYEVTPAAPTGVKVATGDGQLTISWTAAKNATGYEIYEVTEDELLLMIESESVEEESAVAAQSDAQYNYKKIKTTSATSAVITGLTNKSAYTYVVKSVRKRGSYVTNSNYSASATGTPVIGKPKAPSSLSVTNNSSGSTLKWSAGSLSDGYYIYRYNYNKNQYEQIATTSYTSYVDAKSGTKGKLKYMVKAYRTEDNEKFYVSDSGVEKMIFGSSDIQAANNVHPIYYSAKITSKTGLYGSFRNNSTKKGTISAGTRVTIIYRRWKQSKVSYKGKSYYIYNSAMHVSGQSYTSKDYSEGTKLAFINTGGYKSKSKYLIWISTYTQHINIFEGSEGKWKLIKTGQISSGRLSNYTPLGDFSITRKRRAHYYGRSHYYYLSYFKSENKMHTRPAYNGGGYHDARLGRPLSSGCVRLTDGMAKWVYNNCPKGATVLVY